jgi:hypothetical protein
MKLFVYCSITLFVIIFLMLLISIAHERDILQSCIKYGNSGRSMWTTKIICSPSQDLTEKKNDD